MYKYKIMTFRHGSYYPILFGNDLDIMKLICDKHIFEESSYISDIEDNIIYQPIELRPSVDI